MHGYCEWCFGGCCGWCMDARMNSVVDGGVESKAPNNIHLDNGGEFVNNKMLAVC